MHKANPILCIMPSCPSNVVTVRVDARFCGAAVWVEIMLFVSRMGITAEMSELVIRGQLLKMA